VSMLPPPAPERPGRGRQVWLAVAAAVLLVGISGGVVWVGGGHSGPPGAIGDSANGPTPATTPFGFAQPTATVSGTAGPLAGAGALGRDAPTAAWVVAENDKPGTRDWVLSKPSTHHEIEGFADHVSIDEGASVNLYVSTTAPSFHVEAFRMGYYGGSQGRLVWTSPDVSGSAQAPFSVTPGVNMVEDNWQPSLNVQTTTAAWPQGDYLFKLVASTGYQSYVPLTIRDDASTAAYMINNDVTTWQAYNLYGGYDLYQGPKGYASRSRVVSFDRPYMLGTGSGDFLGNELHAVSLMESLGLDVTYTTSVDLDQNPQLVLAHRTFLSLGHDEYYSMAMRNGLTAALGQGVNLVFFGANAIYRHIRFEASPLGQDRHEIDYKDAQEDPLYGIDNANVTPVAWRDPPNNEPESVIIGDYYQCNPVLADMVVSDPGSWIFAGTGAEAGTRLSNLVGTEFDHYDPSAPGPRNVTILARSPLTCDRHANYADMTYYTAPSGSGVFATGTLNWVPDMVPTCGQTGCPGPTVTRVTENILMAFGSGPAGAAHPSVANWQTTSIPKVVPTPNNRVRGKSTPTPTATGSPGVGEGTGQ
jgi:hypothetical protein